jgi:hypothetical protein
MAEKKKAAISVIERRLQGASALQTSSQPIPLREKGWTLRWENSEIRPDQIWHCVNTLGWEYVAPSDIACTMDEIGANERDGRVVRGPRGGEVLLKMRTSDYKKIQMKKSQENVDLTFNKQKVGNAALNAVGSEFGSEAADFVRSARIDVTDSRETVALDE